MKKNRKNCKGYMLVEIILASTIAFALAYFMLELTLRLKGKNDDLLVATLMATDRTIISNKIMSKVRLSDDYSNISDNIKLKNVTTLNIYGEEFKINKYAQIDSNIGVTTEVIQNKILHVNVPLRIMAYKDDKQFDVDLYYLIPRD